jgi:hypothetical protein
MYQHDFQRVSLLRQAKLILLLKDLPIDALAVEVQGRTLENLGEDR